MRLSLTIILLSILLASSYCQADNPILSRSIPTPVEGSTSKAILDSLINNYGLLITYQSNDPALKYPVELPKKDNITIKELLDILQQNLPYEFLYKNGYIILRKKTMRFLNQKAWLRHLIQ